MLFDGIEWNIKPRRYLLGVVSLMLANIFQSQFLTIIYSAIYSAIYIRLQWCLKPYCQTDEVGHKVKFRLWHTSLLAQLVNIGNTSAPTLHLATLEQSRGYLLIHGFRMWSFQANRHQC